MISALRSFKNKTYAKMWNIKELRIICLRFCFEEIDV